MKNHPHRPYRHMNRPLSWFVQLLKTSATQHSWRQANKQTNISSMQLAESFFIRRDRHLWIHFPTTLLFHLHYWTLWVSVQLFWILIEALKSCSQEERLRNNWLNNTIDKIVLVVINYFEQLYFWFWGRIDPSWRFTSFPLWTLSLTCVQS